MKDLISRQVAAIDTNGLGEEIRCEMCKNPIHTDRGCDGHCKYDEKLYEKIIQILDKRITPLPSVQPEQVCVAHITLTDEQVKEAVEKAKNAVFSVIKPDPQWMPCSKTIDIPDHEVEIVRCKDCKYMTEHYDTDGNAPYWTCSEWDSGTDYDGFCHYAERRTDGR